MEVLDREVSRLSVSSGSVAEWRVEGAGAGASSFSAVNELGEATAVCSFLLLLRILLLFWWFVRVRAKWIVSVGLDPVSHGQLGSAPWTRPPCGETCLQVEQGRKPLPRCEHTGSQGQLREAKVSVGSGLGLVFPWKPALAGALLSPSRLLQGCWAQAPGANYTEDLLVSSSQTLRTRISFQSSAGPAGRRMQLSKQRIFQNR